jgi:hypothetical protein
MDIHAGLPPPRILSISYAGESTKTMEQSLPVRYIVNLFKSVLRIRIHIFLGLSDPLVRGTDPDPDPDPTIISLTFFNVFITCCPGGSGVARGSRFPDQ